MGFAPGKTMMSADMTYCQNRSGRFHYGSKTQLNSSIGQIGVVSAYGQTAWSRPGEASGQYSNIQTGAAVKLNTLMYYCKFTRLGFFTEISIVNRITLISTIHLISPLKTPCLNEKWQDV